MNTQDLKDLPVLRASLDNLAERTAPTSSVDVHAALRSGVRARQRRTVGRFGTAAAVVAAGALCFTSLPAALHQWGNERPGNGLATVSPGPADPLAMALIPGTDPYDLSGEFGWLPSGYTAVEGTQQYFGLALELHAQGPQITLPRQSSSSPGQTTTFDAGIHVEFSKRLNQVSQYRFAGPAETSTVTIGGQPANLQVGPVDVGQPSEGTPNVNELMGLLSWQTASGDYVLEIAFFPAGTPDVASAITHVAQTLSISDTPTSFPFYLKNIPASMGGYTESGPGSSPRGGKWEYSLTLGVDEEDQIFISVSAQEIKSGPGGLLEQGLACKVENGVHICIYTAGAPLPTPIAKIGLKGFLNDIVGVGTDPSAWTTDVIR